MPDLTAKRLNPTFPLRLGVPFRSPAIEAEMIQKIRFNAKAQRRQDAKKGIAFFRGFSAVLALSASR